MYVTHRFRNTMCFIRTITSPNGPLVIFQLKTQPSACIFYSSWKYSTYVIFTHSSIVIFRILFSLSIISCLFKSKAVVFRIQYNTIQYICNRTQSNAMPRSAFYLLQIHSTKCYAMQFNTLQCIVILCNTIKCNAIQYNAM